MSFIVRPSLLRAVGTGAYLPVSPAHALVWSLVDPKGAHKSENQLVRLAP